ncbi:MAG: hypothetical protein WCN98_05505 [Verrucomicrobiaceae bacterium]
MLDPYEYLARRRFPQAYQGFVPGQDDFTRRRQREFYASQATAYIEELRAKPAEELRTILLEEKNKETDETAERLRREEDARFFNRPAAQADFTHWSKAAYWTLEEAVALSFGKAPHVVNWKSIEAHLGVSPFVVSYRDLRDLANRAKHMGQLYDPVVPGIYLAWAGRMGAKIDPRLLDGVVANGSIVADWKTMFDAEQEAHRSTKATLAQQREELISWAKEQHTQALELGKSAVAERVSRIRELENQISQAAAKSERALSTRERTSLLTLVIGMAIKGYTYDPASPRNKAIPEIASDLNELGLSLDQDTVRKYLNEGKELLPRDKTE